jgi:glycosyltransferase involved in cell wall biosynthesis
MLQLSGFAEMGERLQSVSTDADGFRRFMALYPALEALQAEYEQLSADDRREAVELILADRSGGLFARIAQLSFASKLSGDPHHMRAIAGPEFDQAPEAIQYFLNWQVTARGFLNATSVDGPTMEAVQARYLRLVRRYADALGLNLPYAPPAERDWNRVVLITIQMLGPQHAPTFDALDYAARLVRAGKRPLLINTGLYPRALSAPFYAPVLASHSADRDGMNRVVHNGVEIDFHQVAPAMPDQDEIVRLTKALYAARPGYVISMGHSNLLADLCGTFTTTVGFPFGTEFQVTAASTYVLPRAWREGDEVAAAQRNLTRDLVLATDYRFSRPPPVRTFSRQGVGEEGSILIAVVGTRLDVEASAAWMKALGDALDRNPDLVVIFAGAFTRYAERVATHASLSARTYAVGLIDDVPALLDCCDLYLNPPRTGGGSSAAYALAAGSPVLTDPTGDVARVAGDTALPGLHELDATVQRWRDDLAWRAEMIQRARRRWAEISDRDGLLHQIDDLARAHAHRRASIFVHPS